MTLKISNTRCVALVLVSLLEIFLFGGIPFGWFALVFILKQEGVFKHLCDSESDVNTTSVNLTSDLDCFPQDERLHFIFSVAVPVFTLGTILCGQLYLSFGIKRIRLIYISIAVPGILFIAFTSPENPWLPLPGIILVGGTGLALLISNFIQVPFLLPRGSSIYVGLLNGCYDSSVLTFMLVKKLYEDGVDKKFSFFGVAILFIMVSGVCTLLHPSRDRKAKSEEEIPPTNNDIFTIDESTVAQNTVTSTSSVNDGDPPLGEILRSSLFYSHLVWLTISLLKYVFFLGSANRWMEHVLEDQERVSYFTDVMTFTMMGSLVSSFIAGYTIHAVGNKFTGNMKTVVPLTVTSCLVILLSALAFVQTPSALYAEFIVLTFFRSFMYTINMEFIRIAFPRKYNSILFGIIMTISGILATTQYGLFAWTENYAGAMTHVNILLLCLSTVSLFHSLLVFYNHRRQQHL